MPQGGARDQKLGHDLKVFFYFSVMETSYSDKWLDMTQPCDMDLWVIKGKSTWPTFHGPVILPYILKTIWYMNTKLWAIWYMNNIRWDYKSVWHDIWPQNKCRSLWPIFNGPVILPYSLKTIWYMNTKLWDYESVWPDVWPQNICRTLWPIFHGPLIVPYSLKTISCMNIICRFKNCYTIKLFEDRPGSLCL